jgi:signal transduction histidine kinase
MTFKTAYLKLTLYYVAIVMLISAIFSIALYQMSSSELNRGLNRQNRFLRELPPNILVPIPTDQMEQIRFQQLEESSWHLKRNLIYFNLLILILSSIGSYFFAKRTLRPIEKMMEAQNRFTADASHELRTPLAALRAEIEVALRDKNINLASSKKLLTSNLEEIEKLEALSGALLKLAKYQEQEKLASQELLLDEVVVSAFEKVENLANKKSIEFKNNLQKIKIQGDRESLKELFVILLDNAIKYSPQKSKICIDIEKEKKQAVARIKDQGIGIKSSDLPFIFNRFYRADISRSKEKVDGYGLGLSIAKQIVDLHKGEISASSHPGKGSIFTIKLPS